MDNLSLQKRFVIVSVNGTEAGRISIVTKLRNRCIVLAGLINLIMENKMEENSRKYRFIETNDWKANKNDGLLYDLLKGDNGNSYSIAEWVDMIEKIPQKKCDHFATEIIKEMMEEDLIENVLSLLSSDLYYHTAGTEIRAYRSSYGEYHNTVEYIKAEILDGGEVSDEIISLIWLLKQSGNLLDIFSVEEVHRMKGRINKIYKENDYTNSLFSVVFAGEPTRTWKNFLDKKKKFAQTQFGVGFVFTTPIIERSEAIFIDTEKLFANSKERLEDVLRRLEGSGHVCVVESRKEISLLEIDNVLYELIPDGIKMKFAIIYGVRLRRYVIV